MERSRRENALFSINEIRNEITPETRNTLEQLEVQVNKLWDSLNSDNEESIKYFHNKLLKEQQRTPQNESLIDGLKLELMGAYVPFYTKMEEILASDIPKKLDGYLKNYNINIKLLPQNLLTDISGYMSQALTANVKENKFRLSVWIDYISNLKNILYKILHEQENA